MDLLTVDVESYYDTKYSLRVMTPPEYILDDRWELQICAVAINDEPPEVLQDAGLRHFLQGLDPNCITVVSHNMLFDGSVLAWRYGFVPYQMLDTLGMARALFGHSLRSLALASVAKHMGLGSKGSTLPKVKGLHLEGIVKAGLYEEFCTYCANDLQLCRAILKNLLPVFPVSQLRFMDRVLRCATQPKLVVNRPRLTGYLAEAKAKKAALLKSCGLDKSELMSADKFQTALKARGITVQMKAGKNEKIPAFAKTDPFMVELQEHEDLEIQALANARLGVKSTLEEKRAEKMLAISALPWAQPCSLPIPLRFAGAHTLRLSGEWGINMQNLPRATTAGSQLRRCVEAIAGCSIIVSDLGQIEARLVAWLAGAEALVKQFADKLDPYARLAESIFGYKVDRKVQIAEGFVGKQGILGLGYGLGADNFYLKTKMAARGQGIDLGSKFTPEIAERAVKAYRRDNKEVPETWYWLNDILSTAFINDKNYNPVQVGPVEIGKGYVLLPDGCSLQYAAPTKLAGGNARYTHPYGYFKKLWGGAFLENIIQALAGQIIRDTWMRLDKLGYSTVWQVHDELIFVVPDTDLDNAKQVIHSEMVRRPKWALDLPLSADIGSGKDYGSCK